MAEAVILGVIQKLESCWLHDNMDSRFEEPMKHLFDELRMMADFLRDKKMGEGRSRLNYLISDVVEMVQEIVDLDHLNFTDEFDFIGDWVRDTRMRMINLEVGWDEPFIITTEDSGEGDEEVVGLEEDVKVLLDRGIFNEEESLSTLLVKGMPGIGKTALARQVYNHPAVIDLFKHRAWVSLSSDSTIKEILIKIILQVVACVEPLQRDSLLEKMERADIRSLQEMLRHHLQGMPYLIVVDNMLKGMRYYARSLLNCLPNDEEADNGSRLMLTSRSLDYVETVDYVHEMKVLDSEKSWQLFVKTINKFTSDEEQYKFPKHLEKKGKDMTRTCGGLPVAIIDVGRQKAKQKLEKGLPWEELLEIDSIDWSVSLELLESGYCEVDEELPPRFMYVDVGSNKFIPNISENMNPPGKFVNQNLRKKKNRIFAARGVRKFRLCGFGNFSNRFMNFHDGFMFSIPPLKLVIIHFTWNLLHTALYRILLFFVNFTISRSECSLPHTAEAVILGMLWALEIWVQDRTYIFEENNCEELVKEILDELRMMADFLRPYKILGEGSRTNYMVCDVVEIVQEISYVGKKVEAIRDWVRDRRMYMIKLGVDGVQPLITATDHDEEGDEEVVGLEEDVKVLLDRGIFNEEESLSTLVVKGMPGIGKTALARQVYNHKAVIDRFKHRAWVSLSSDSTIKELIVKIMLQVVGSEELHRDSLLGKMEHEDIESLERMLHLHLEGKSFLIVVDNVPKGTRYMRYFFKCLQYEVNGSRLMLTSRSWDDVEAVHYVHEMKVLDREKSWQLFVNTINKFTSYEEQYKFPKHLEKKGKDMTKVCGGLPVAIVDVGRQIAKQRLEMGIQWEELLEIDSIDWSVSLELLESGYRELDEELQPRFILPHTVEAIILRMLWELEIWVRNHPNFVEKKYCKELMKEIFDELRMMADFLGPYKKLGEGSRLNYLICDAVEIVQEILDVVRGQDFIDMVEDTRDWVRDIRMRMIKLGVDGVKPLITTTDYDEERDELEVVGLEEDVKALLRRGIFNREKNLSIFLIKGLPTIGKTTLARQVYNHPAVVDRFKHRFWVSLSSDSTYKELIVRIMLQVVGGEKLRRDSLLDKMERTDNLTLHQMLHQHLQGCPCLIVVDNMRKEMRYLKYIKKCLPYEEDSGNRLLLTSRSREYVKLFHDVYAFDYIHEAKALDSDKGWQLFLKTINKFTSDKFPKHLERKGKEMMAKCGGWPVAIIDAGRRIAKQRLEKGIKWEELLEIDSIDLSASMELLESSYRELDEELQARFVYVAFFKENTIISAKKLKRIWAAAGGYEENTAKGYMYALAEESFLEVVDKGVIPYAYKIKHCCINPLLHRLSIKMAEKDLGFEILRNFDGNSNGANSQASPRRHRVIYCSRDDKFIHYNSTINQDKHLVSLIFHGGGSYLDDANWKRFELLKLLNLEDFGLKILSETLGTTLMELKYLGLRNNYIQEIPRSLGCLKKLEVLDIAQNFMVEVPDIICEMSGLHHLHMSDVIRREPLKIHTLQHLESLSYISVDDVLGLETIPSLQRLGIEEVDENSGVSKLFASLSRFYEFRHLTLRGFRFRSMPCLDEVADIFSLRTIKLDGLLAGLPKFPSGIEELSLVNSCLDEDPMPVLAQLPNLTNLTLQNAYTGRQMVIGKEGFLELEVLRMKELWNLRNLEVAQFGEGRTPMMRLNHLEIDNCPYLDTLPEGIRSMKRMMQLKMVTTKKIATKIRKSGLISIISKTIGVDISP